jgi:hypothetical protein
MVSWKYRLKRISLGTWRLVERRRALRPIWAAPYQNPEK